MSRPPATSRKLRRMLVLLALFLTCQPEPKTGALNSVRGGVREQLQASNADGEGFAWSWGRAVSKADGTLDGGEAEDNEDPCLEASSAKEEVEEATTQAKAGFDQAQWLQKTAEQIRQFGVDEVSSWVRAALEADNYAHKVQEITEILKSEDVMGTALLKLTAEKMQKVGIRLGPSAVLAERIAAVSAPPTAASGLQAGALNRAGS
ncbi:unnamed protein product [Symbiodinium sp. CCMP2592]|nr:unnamed protein product [Symbiodinium sp. CCMP2592]